MAQRQAFTCDGDCGEEIGTRSAPVIYLVIGTSDGGKMDADVKLPPEVWAILKQAVPRKDYCAKCFARAFGAKLLTLEDYEAGLEVGGTV